LYGLGLDELQVFVLPIVRGLSGQHWRTGQQRDSQETQESHGENSRLNIPRQQATQWFYLAAEKVPGADPCSSTSAGTGDEPQI
jgi:hypothetical protein